MDQHRAHLGPTWAKLGQLGLNLGQQGKHEPAKANFRPTSGQLEANMDLKLIEKPLFFLCFFNILRKSSEAIGHALGDSLGTPWGVLGDAWGSLGKTLGGFRDALGALGTPWGVPGDALEDLLGGSCENLERTSLMELPGSTSGAKSCEAS